jgi:hypothetical protein
MNITRREAIQKLALAFGATTLAPRLFAAAAAGTGTPANSGAILTDTALLDEIGDTIIPTTDIPGAKAVGIGAFIAMMVHDCYTPRDQAVVRDGLSKLTEDYRKRYHEEFVGGDPKHRTEFLNRLDREQKAYTEKHKVTPADPDAEEPIESAVPPHYFRVLKEMTVLGYFSSELGCTKALRFVEVPGAYNGSAPYKRGEHAWFS